MKPRHLSPLVAALRLLPVLLLLALLAAAAQAQVPTPIPIPPVPTPPPAPTPPSAAGVDVKAADAALEVTLDGPVSTAIVVTHTGTPTGTPADQPRTVTLSRSDLPAGWEASLSPSEFRIAPGESRTATLTVTLTPFAQDRDATVTVTAKMFAQGINQIPVGGSQLDPESTAATVVQATRADSVTRDVLETVGPYIWVVLLGLVAAVVLAMSLVAANRRVAVRLSSPEAEQAVSAGGRGSFLLRVHNITRQPDTVFLRAAPLPEGWAAYLPTPQVDLDPGQQEEVSVVVIPPKEAEAGAHQAVDVTATSSLAPRRPATMRFEATVEQSKGKKGQ